MLADDLGYGDLGCTGHPYAKTPSIDQLASQGTMFRSFYSVGSTCVPTRVGFMTGRFPDAFSKDVAVEGNINSTTVTEVLKRQGYSNPLDLRTWNRWIHEMGSAWTDYIGGDRC